jgi:nitroreductase
MDCFEVIKKRRSVRKYKDTPVPDDIIRTLIESARLAPSGRNGQGWLFGVITDKNTITRLSAAAGNQTWIATAPLVISLCGKLDAGLRGVPDDDLGLMVNKARFTPEFIKYLQDYPDQRAVSLLFNNSIPMIPGEHIFLTAVENGLSACWVGFLDIHKASEILGLPRDYACLFLMPVGYPDEEPVNMERKSISEIAFLNKYDKIYQ